MGLDMTWQVIDPREASVEDLLQVPVLFVSGSKDPGLDPYAERVRAYLDRGGFLLAEACCVDHSGFEQGFRRFLNKVFPEGEYKLRRAGPEHPIWRVEQPVRPESPYAGRLWTVEYGCRTCVVFSEIDLSCYWELAGLGGETPVELADVVQGRIDDAVAVGLNVLAYATNREPRGKEASFATAGSLAELTGLGSRGVIQIAKLQHGGGCNDAPGALANLLRTAAQGELRLATDLSEYPVLPATRTCSGSTWRLCTGGRTSTSPPPSGSSSPSTSPTAGRCLRTRSAGANRSPRRSGGRWRRCCPTRTWRGCPSATRSSRRRPGGSTSAG